MEKLFKTYAYGHTANTYDALKAIALLTMVVDHIGRYFFPEVEAFRAMGRIAFPLFLFLVGYSGYTKFSPSLFIGACCVLLSSGFTGYPLFPLNILFTILITRAVLPFLVNRRIANQEILLFGIMGLLLYPFTAMFMDYGTLAILIALLGWHTRQGNHSTVLLLYWPFTYLAWLIAQLYIFTFSIAEILWLTATSAWAVLLALSFPHHAAT